MNPRRGATRCAVLFIASLAMAALGACATSMTFGSLPQVDKVPALKVGASSVAEVKNALGEPRGRGRARFAADLPEQDVLFYEFMQSDGRKVQLKMLLVFVDKETYAGHLWFSSGSLIGATR